MNENNETYVIQKDRKTAGGFKITCLKCGYTSPHPGDVDNLYCGHCHIFHERAAGLCVIRPIKETENNGTR